MRFRLNKWLRDISFILILVYYLQTFLQLNGHVFSRISILIFLTIGFFSFVKIFLSELNKSTFFSFSIFVILNIIYFLFNEKSVISPLSHEEVMTYKSIVPTLIVFFGFYISYYFTKNSLISINYVHFLFVVFFITAICTYFSAILKISQSRDVVEFTNNAGYDFVSLLPFLFLIRKKYLSLILLFLFLFFILISAKRGAILIGFIFTFYYIYKIYLSNFRDVEKNLFYVFIIFLLLGYFIYDIYHNNIFLQEKILLIAEGNSSGRDIIYVFMWNLWISSDNIITYIFGSGLLSSVKNFGLLAHNDWLELLTSTGILGVSVYLFIFYEQYKFYRSDRLEFYEKNIVFSILLIWFFKSLFSMGYNSVNMIFPLILLGYICARKNKRILST